MAAAPFSALLALAACGGAGAEGGNSGAGGGGTGAPPGTGGGGTIGTSGCTVFPSDNPWNQDISRADVDPNSDAYITSIGRDGKLHPDFGSDPSYGIPYIVVPGSQPKLPVQFEESKESDPGPYAIPLNAPVEGGGDRHVLAVDHDHCMLYELYAAQPESSAWSAYSGAVFDLRSNKLRPDGYTSADAAGLPILAGLVRYDEATGVPATAGSNQTASIRHALRFTASHTQNAFVHPATHSTGKDTDPGVPPMGARLRLKASFDTSKFHGASKVVLTALQHYGMFLADNGSSWYLSGESNPKWDDADLEQLKTVPGSAFEVVKIDQILKDPQ